MTNRSRLPEDADWQLEGRLVEASNVVLRLRDGDERATFDEARARAVYKPVAGERPLADFPRGTLAHREVATWLVADAAAWSCVPQTDWYDGEFGEGSLQRWVGPLVPEEQTRVVLLEEDDFVEAAGRGGGCLHGVAAFDGEDGPLVLAHLDDATLRQIAVLDVITNNADRKGSHLIETPDAPSLFAIDNGLTFHVDDKLRTVLWGFAGEPLGETLTAGLRRLVRGREALAARLGAHLDHDEIDAFHARTDALLAAGEFPEPPQDRYGLPWPPL